MATRVRIHNIVATLTDEGWSCESASLRKLLNALRESVPISGADPDPAFTIAEAAIKRLGGEMIEHDPPDFDENVVY